MQICKRIAFFYIYTLKDNKTFTDMTTVLNQSCDHITYKSQETVVNGEASWFSDCHLNGIYNKTFICGEVSVILLKV